MAETKPMSRLARRQLSTRWDPPENPPEPHSFPFQEGSNHAKCSQELETTHKYIYGDVRRNG